MWLEAIHLTIECIYRLQLNPGVMPFVPSNYCMNNNEYSWMRRLTEDPGTGRSDQFTCWNSPKSAQSDDIWASQNTQSSSSLYSEETKRSTDTGNNSRGNLTVNTCWASSELSKQVNVLCIKAVLRLVHV